MKIVQTNYGLRIYLDEVDKKIFKASWPMPSWVLTMMVKTCSSITLALIAQGKEKIVPYFNRIRGGEPADKVVPDIIKELNFPLSNLEIPEVSVDEIEAALGWSVDKEEQK